MGYVCAIAGGKGGVGKTTTAINLATVMAEDGDVALVDADLGMANVAAMLGIDPEGTLHDVLAGEATLDDVIVEGETGPAVVAGARGLDAYADADPGGLRDVIADLRADYDLVVVDTGAGLSHDGLVPLGLADGILLVATPDEVAMRDTEKTADLATRVDGSVLGVVVTRATPETDLEGFATGVPFPMLGAVPDDPGATASQPLVRTASDGPAAVAYRRLAGTLGSVFFDGARAADLADAWETPDFPPTSGTADGQAPAGRSAREEPDATSTAADDGASADADDDDPETEESDTDSGGVFGLFR